MYGVRGPRTVGWRAVGRVTGIFLTTTFLIPAGASTFGTAWAQSTPDARPAAQTLSAQPLLAQATPTYRFDIAPQPLTAALVRFSDTTNIQFFFDSAMARNLQSPGASGTLQPEEALRRLLAGTGLTYRFTNPTTVTLQMPAAQTGGAVQLDPVTVEGSSRRERALGAVAGYVATRNTTGSKTDTPILETPQAVSVVTRDRMEAQGVTSLGSALRYTPGVSAEAFGIDTREGGLRVRGFDAGDNGLYRDSLPLPVTQFTNFQLEPYGAERIEVLRGPASVLYGRAQPGGLINYVSKRPTEDSVRELQLGLGSFERKDARFDLGGAVSEDGTLLYRLTGMVRDSGTQVDHVDQNRIFIAPSFTWKPTENTSLTVLGQYQRDETGWGIQFLPAAGTIMDNPNGRIRSNTFIGEPDFDQYDLDQTSVGYELEHRVGDVWTFRQNARYQHLINKQKSVYGGGLQADMRTTDRYADQGKSSLNGVVVDNQVQVTFTTGRVEHRLLLGVDYQHFRYNDYGVGFDAPPIDIYNPVYGQRLTPYGVHTDVSARQNQLGVYAQEQLTFDRKWVLTLGGRKDWVDSKTDDRLGGAVNKQKDSDVTGRVGLVYLSDSGLAPYVSYSESFLPTLGTDSAGGALKPETARQYEAGVKYQPQGGKSFVAASVFDLQRKNYVTYEPPTYEGRQFGRIEARGLELEAVSELTQGLQLIATYSWLRDFKIAESANPDEVGKRGVGVPKYNAALWLDYTVQEGSLGGLGLGGGVRRLGWSYGDSMNSFKVPAVTLTDAAVHYDWNKVRLGLNVSNLFDKEYIAACQTSVSHCYYGAGRTVLGTLRYSW